IEFCKKNNLKKYPFLSNKIYEKFSNDCAQFNGPFTWINLRYQGSFGEKNRILKNTFNELIKLNCKLKFNPKLYLVYVLNLVTPKIILKNIQTLVVKMYFLFS
ncbi:MAG: hypothetical protein NTZ55_04890, partial [Candidatus Roizmanbacteria bacterium]|nr:hypothetical protein [Candidatus Roizmanbacteria bacterium]